MAHPIDEDIDDFADLDARSDLRLIHDRTYRVRSYREADNRMRLRGMVRDLKPAGLYIPGDSIPMQVHHMVVDLVVAFPSLEITDANVVLETHPHEGCVRIEDHYKKLIGLSIARGFTHKIRELFGGPRGCTHTTALLQAMAPVAIQSTWSMRAVAGQGALDRHDESVPVEPPKMMTPEQRKAALMFNINTCHIWDEEGEHVAAVMAGEPMEVPVWAQKRLRELGRSATDWNTMMRGE